MNDLDWTPLQKTESTSSTYSECSICYYTGHGSFLSALNNPYLVQVDASKMPAALDSYN